MPLPDFVRRRLAGRHVVAPFRGGFVRGLNQAEAMKGHPIGYKHDELARIPKSHVSSRSRQDDIEEIMKAQIRNEPAGPRRDWLIKDLEMWQANGRPVAGSFKKYNPRNKTTSLDRQAEPVKTWQNGKPLSADFTDGDALDNARKIRRMLRGE